jgi:serine/threonine protein phosphatase 1
VFIDNTVGYAIGDVHGRADLLDRLLDRLEADAPRSGPPPVVIFMGDYIDRGPESKRVLDLLASGRPFGFKRRFVMGNHEQMLMRFVNDPIGNRGWLALGGLPTLNSYGVRLPSMNARAAELRYTAAALVDRIPETHKALLRGLERFIELGSYLFVHAGIDPGKALTEQSDSDLFWIRERFLSYAKPLSHCVVHGHTPVARPSATSSRIAIDTGAYATGLLTAVRLEGADRSFMTA